MCYIMNGIPLVITICICVAYVHCLTKWGESVGTLLKFLSLQFLTNK